MSSVHADRRRRARERMARAGVDLLALGPGSNMRWLLGYEPHGDERPTLLLLSGSGEAFLAPAVNEADIRGRIDVPVAAWTDEQGPEPVLRDVLSALGVGPTGGEAMGGEAASRGASASGASVVALDEPMRTDFALTLLRVAGGFQPVGASSVLGPLRAVKGAAEIAAIRASARIADAAVQAAFAAIEAGVDEREVAEAVRRAFLAQGADRVDLTIVAGGPNSAYPHHQTGTRTIRAGEPVLVDIGATKDGYASDITRMAHVGDPPDAYREIHAIVEAAVQAALAAAQPGALARDVDRAARTVIADAGYADRFPHRVGHGLGLDGHEPPYLTAASDTVLEPGMVFSIEPGIYLEGRFGVRLEEIVVLGEDGPAVLSSLGRGVVGV